MPDERYHDYLGNMIFALLTFTYQNSEQKIQIFSLRLAKYLLSTVPTFLVGVVGDLILLLHEELVVVLDAGGEEVELGPGGGQPGVGLGLAAVLLVLVLDQAHDVVLGAALDPARELPHLVVLQHATCHVSRVAGTRASPRSGRRRPIWPRGPGS